MIPSLLKRLNTDWKLVAYWIILSVLGFLAFTIVLYDLTN